MLEVENLIKALKAAGKPFQHKVYQDAPGGHRFNRLDTRLAKQSRALVFVKDEHGLADLQALLPPSLELVPHGRQGGHVAVGLVRPRLTPPR